MTGPSKDIQFSLAAREKLMNGVNKAGNAVSATLGPKGRNAVIGNPFGGLPKVTKDGVTVAKAIKLADKFEDMGAQFIREVASKAVDRAGDGTTTATVLAQALSVEGVKAVAAGMNPMDLKRGMELAVDLVVKDLKARSREVASSEEIAQVGIVSANGEKEIGNMIADAMHKVGKEGVITVEENKGIDTVLEVVEGMQVSRGYLSPYFATNDKLLCELDNPLILLHDSKISSLQTILHLLEASLQAQKPLLIIADDIDGEALSALVVNKVRGNLKVCAIKAPNFGETRKEVLQDLAVLTSGQVISDITGLTLEKTTVNMLGTCKRVVISKDTTTFIDGAGTKEDIDARCQAIRQQITETESEYDKSKLQERLAKLSGGIAVICVGGVTEAEVKERKDRVDDALAATRAAVEEGIIVGGGAALLYATRALKDVKGQNDDQRRGVDIVRKALEAPIRKIAENAGVDHSVVVGTVLCNTNTDMGYNAQSDQYVNMMETGIIDPTKVVRIALESAASIAALIITTEVAIADIDEPAEKNKG